VRRAAAERTLAAGVGEAADGTMLPGPSDSDAQTGAVPPSIGQPSSTLDPERKHRATADTSVSLASPSIKTIEGTDAPPPMRRDFNTVAPDAANITDADGSADGDGESLGASCAGPVLPRFDSVATVDPRYFGDSEWDRWGKKLTGKSAAASSGSAESSASRRSTSTDSRYVGKTPVSARPLTPQGAPPMPGDEYAIMGRLGEGGMGIVYTATQRAIARDVALKMLKPETARRRDRRDSLASEAIVTGELAHPNIVPVYDLGQDADGSLFYSMKRVEGIRWDTVLGTKSESENLDILLRVADAIAFAHDRGVVNRDLKPENVFLGGFGEVLVMDWGLAYATDRFKKLDSIVENVSMGGSPAYMAPEQARNFLVAGGWRAGELEPITPALDVYLLGAMLFEVVTGQPPHGDDDPTMCVMAAAENRIRHHESDSQLLPIALKAMASEPSERYASALDFQQAIREYLAHSESLALTDRAHTRMKEGDLARAVVAFEDALSLWPENPVAQSRVVVARRRLTRRRYALTAMTAAFLVAIAAGSYGVDYQRRIAVKERSVAVKERGIAVEEKKNAVAAAIKEKEAREQVVAALAAVEAQKSIAEARRSEAQAAETKARAAEKIALDAEKVATANEIAARRAEAEAKEAAEKERIARRDADKSRERQAYLRYKAEIANIDRLISENKFKPANTRLDTLKDDSPELCGWEWGRLKYLCSEGNRSIDVGVPITAAAAAADGSFAVTALEDGRIRLFERKAFTDPSVGSLEFNAPADAGLVRPLSVAVTANHQFVAAAGDAGAAAPVIMIWPTTSRDQAAPIRLEGHAPGSRVVSLVFFGNDSRLLSASNSEVFVWDVATRSIIARVRSGFEKAAEEGTLSCATVSPDGKRVVYGTSTGTIVVRSLTDRPKSGETLGVGERRAFDGHITQRAHGDAFRYRAGAITSLTFSPDGRRIFSGDGTGHVLRWDPETDVKSDQELGDPAIAALVKATPTLGSQKKLPAAIAKSVPENTRAASVAVYSDTSAVLSINALRAHDGRTVVITSGENGVIKVWDASAWDERTDEIETLAEFRGHSGRAVAASFVTADGLEFVSAGEDETARLRQLGDDSEVRELKFETLTGHEGAILTAAFDPSGRHLMTAGTAEEARVLVTDLHDVEPRRESQDVAGAFFGTQWVVPTPDGEFLLTGSLDGTTVLWDVESRTALQRLHSMWSNALLAPAVSPNSKFVATFHSTRAGEHSVAIWPLVELAKPAAPLPEPIVVETVGDPAAAAFTADERLLVVGDAPSESSPRGGMIYVRDVAGKSDFKTRLFGDGEQGRIVSIVPLPGGDVLIAGKNGPADDVHVLRWNPTTHEPSGPVAKGDPWAVKLAGAVDLVAMAADTNGTRLVTLTTQKDPSQHLQLWDLAGSSHEHLKQQILPSSLLATSIGMAPGEGKAFLMASHEVDAAPVGRARSAKNTAVWLVETETLTPRDFEGTKTLLTHEAIGPQKYPTGVSAIAFSPDERTAFLAGSVGVYEFNLKQRKRLDGLFGSHGGIPSSGFSADGKYLVSGRQDGSFDIFVASAQPPALPAVTLKAPGVYTAPVTAAAFSPVPGSYKFLIAAGGSLTLHEFDPAAGETRLLKSLSKEQNAPTKFNAAAFSADGRWIAAGGEDGIVRLFDTEAQDASRVMISLVPKEPSTGHTKRVNSVAVASVRAPGNRLVVASGSDDETAIVWVVDSASQGLDLAVPLRGHAKAVTSVAFAPGKFDRLVTGSSDRTARIWDWDGGGTTDWNNAEELAELKAPAGETLVLDGVHSEGLTVVAFSPDGLTVVTAGQDGRAVLWPSKEPPRQKPVEARRPLGDAPPGDSLAPPTEA
jgi:WD40 repeat protein/serine/threonine protein kinase